MPLIPRVAVKALPCGFSGSIPMTLGPGGVKMTWKLVKTEENLKDVASHYLISYYTAWVCMS